MKAQLVKRDDRWDLYNEDGHKIASTLDGATYKLSLKNCQVIELGYDLDELFDEVDESIDYHEFDFTSFRLGFQKALELMGDKKFSEEDVINLIKKSREKKPYNFDGKSTEYKFLEDELIQSLQQTEWDVEIVEFTADDLKSINNEWHMLGELKLDADGCLILKRI